VVAADMITSLIKNVTIKCCMNDLTRIEISIGHTDINYRNGNGWIALTSIVPNNAQTDAE